MKMKVNTFCHAGTDGYGVRMRDGRHDIKDDERGSSCTESPPYIANVWYLLPRNAGYDPIPHV